MIIIVILTDNHYHRCDPHNNQCDPLDKQYHHCDPFGNHYHCCDPHGNHCDPTCQGFVLSDWLAGVAASSFDSNTSHHRCQ